MSGRTTTSAYAGGFLVWLMCVFTHHLHTQVERESNWTSVPDPPEEDASTTLKNMAEKDEEEVKEGENTRILRAVKGGKKLEF
jgi:hypothetical protein